MLHRYHVSFLAILLTSLFLFSGCSHNDHDSRPRVVASTSIIADLVQVIAGNTIQLSTLMGPGIAPHV